ncbi:beta-lactamase family protein [Metarhizium album ARSEF 1941]|uniref:Beta-lactamase family protein n=1 Tax=Metarhizium album (strain ARSEF 1941) TaxID=1081103 RepID=A0A0B2WWJ8_METAS|nr:beta-lactamase family protein [Metarhizium album ARSEF 1941]KHN98443.1 beta-lactamase family protein [Metarhizium album ARSEF 1941]
MDFFNSREFSLKTRILIRKYHVPGLAIAIVHNDTTASKAFGMASFDPPKPMTADTLLDIASASKSLTAASVALLVNDENYPDVTYEAEMATLLPDDFVMPGQGCYQGVTVEDILSHRSGMASHDNSYLGVRSNNPDTAQSVTRNLRNLAPAAPIRSKFIYSNIMFAVASYLVEKKTGLTFANFLQKHFFRPLRMISSTLQPGGARNRGLGYRISPGHWWDHKTNKYSTFMTPDFPEAQGAGSIVTSVNDYIKYVKALMNQEEPFTEDVYEGLIRPRIIISPDEAPRPFSSPPLYATGWEVHHYRGHMFIIHDGCISGSSSSHFFVPDFKFGAVIMCNSDSGSLVADILVQTFLDELLSVPQDQRVDWDEVLYEMSPEKKVHDEEEQIEEERQRLCPGIKVPEPQTMPLDAYTGEYRNPGWGRLAVQVKRDALFIDCTDRSYVFTLNFQHVSGQDKYIVLYREVTQGPSVPLRAEFTLENDVATRLGIAFDEDLDDYIWFDKVDDVGGESLMSHPKVTPA